MSEITLADAIQQLRADLSRAIEEGRDRDIKFKLGHVDLELQLQVGREREGRVGLQWLVVASGAAKSSSNVTHKLTLRLEPELSGGDDLRISDRRDRPPK